MMVLFCVFLIFHLSLYSLILEKQKSSLYLNFQSIFIIKAMEIVQYQYLSQPINLHLNIFSIFLSFDRFLCLLALFISLKMLILFSFILICFYFQKYFFCFLNLSFNLMYIPRIYLHFEI